MVSGTLIDGVLRMNDEYKIKAAKFLRPKYSQMT
jgi:hypothetical protein